MKTCTKLFFAGLICTLAAGIAKDVGSYYGTMNSLYAIAIILELAALIEYL